MRGNIRLNIKLKVLNSCVFYVFTIASYGCESWTWSKKMREKALEMWCYRKMLKINFRDRIKKGSSDKEEYRVAFLERYDKAEIEVCWTCIERIDRFIALLEG